jgi:hypothetical protein
MATQLRTKENGAANEPRPSSAVSYPPSAFSQTRFISGVGINQALGLTLRPANAWVWPLTAAIVMGGSILFWSLVGLFWLAARPPEPPIVIRMAPSEIRSDAGDEVEYDNGHRSVPVIAEAIR